MELIIGTAVLMGLHVIGSKLHFIRFIPRSRWLSFAGGISVSYVFLRLIPEIAAAEELLSPSSRLHGVEELVPYLLALTGLVLFYGVEVWIRGMQRSDRREEAAFAASMTSYFIYNVLIAVLLHDVSEQGTGSFIAFTIAIGVHLVVNDFALRDKHERRYATQGRWLLVAGLFVGATLGAVVGIPEKVTAAVIAFIGGSVILNVLKEEIPAERESSFLAFAAGAAGYGAVLIVA